MLPGCLLCPLAKPLGLHCIAVFQVVETPPVVCLLPLAHRNLRGKLLAETLDFLSLAGSSAW